MGEPEQDNDAVRLHFVNEYFLRRDGGGCMRNNLSLGGYRVTGMADPKGPQEAVNLRTFQALTASVLEHAATAADTLVGDAITNHANILN